MKSSRAEKIGLKKSLFIGPKNIGSKKVSVKISKNWSVSRSVRNVFCLLFLILIAVLVELHWGPPVLVLCPPVLTASFTPNDGLIESGRKGISINSSENAVARPHSDMPTFYYAKNHLISDHRHCNDRYTKSR